jgi:hypothetical protein
MNSFYEHHKDSIRFHYRCFDRILLNGFIQPFQQPERVVGFFDTYRQLYPVSRNTLHDIADRFQQWLKPWSEKRNIPVLEAPKGRRDEVVAVLKAREPARIMIAIGDRAANRWHLQFAERWVVQYNFYVNDERWGRMFVRMSPYLPFSARVCLNQHHWLANRMREEGIDFRQCSNAFMRCAKPERLQELADELTPHDLVACGQKWLACFTPFFTAAEREQAGCQHRPFFAQTDSATISCFIAAPPSTSSASGSSTPIEPSDSRTRSPRSSAAGSAGSITANCRPRSSTWTSPIR